MTITSFDYNNKKRDLTDLLSTLIAGQSNFLSLFPRVEDARQRKHEWLELQVRPRAFVTTAINAGVCTVTAAESAKCYTGQLVSLTTDSAVFRVTTITPSAVTLEFVSANGSDTTDLSGLPSGGGTFRIQSTPMPSASMTGEDTFRQSGTEYNATQIFRKNFTLSATSTAIQTYGNENAMNYQEGHALFELTRDINRAAILGARVDPSPTVNGALGGLSWFGSQPDGLSITLANTPTLDDFIINDAAQEVINAGGTPDLILVNQGQARVLSASYTKQLFYTRPEEIRGTYVGQIATQSSGGLMRIFQEVDVLDTEAWVVDSSCFGLSYLAGRGVESTPAGSADLDGIARKVIAELTLEFKNAKQRICKIKGLKGSAAALLGMK